MFILVFVLLLHFVHTSKPPAPLLTPPSLTLLSRRTSLSLQAAERDPQTGTTRATYQISYQSATKPSRLHNVCINYGLQICISTSNVSSNDTSFLGQKIPTPCSQIQCNILISDASNEFSHSQQRDVVWNGTPNPMNPSRNAIYATLSITSHPTIIITASNQIHTTRSTLAIPAIPIETNNQNDDNDNDDDTFEEIKLLIEFPPPNAEIWSEDLRVSTIVEVEDPMNFAARQDNIRACFHLIQISSKQTKPPSVTFCEELDVSVLRFKHLNNGTYTLTLWLSELMHSKPTDNTATSEQFQHIENENQRMHPISKNVTRLFVVKKGSSLLNQWTIDPRIRLKRPSFDPTTSLNHRGWPCCDKKPNVNNRKYERDSQETNALELPTARSAIPWKNEAQLTIPSSSSSSSSFSSSDSEKIRIPPVTSYAWERERDEGDVVLVLGIKVEATGFEYRNAIRTTWMSKNNLDVDVKGIPHFNTSKTMLHQILMEANEHSDMLLGNHKEWQDSFYPWHVFQVQDSYYTLVEKTLTFMEFAVRTYPNFRYLMVVDNDVYVRLDNLTSVLRSTSMSNVQKFFAGQVWQIQYGRPLRPQRDIDLKNYLPWKLWPSRDFPPVAIGPHYLMSRDCVEFLTYNKLSLRGVGTLEDVSISVWLRAYGVIPEHVKWFSNAKNFGCVDGVVSLSDLSILAIHTIHTNVINGDNFCLGMMGETKEDGSTSAWQKQNETSTV